MKRIRISTKLLMGTAIAIASLVSFTACSDDDDDGGNGTNNNNNNGDVVEVLGNITENVTWTSNNIYNLKSRVIVTNGAILTIEAGTIIKGDPGSESDAKPLVIARGAKIMARGTAASPIIFTSSADDIEVGEIVGSNLTETNRGLWAGLIILGNAPISPKSSTTDRIEGIPADVAEGAYGGTNANDNSGVLQYVSIRHGGVELVPGGGNEINGLTLGGVGNGTTMDHIEVVANLDDGIEWFGGTVDVSHALVGYQGDDAFDIDQAYSGTINNVLYISGADSDHGLEIDGPEGPENADGAFTLTGGAFQGEPTAARGEFADFRANAKGTVSNLYFFNFKDDADIELDAGDADDDAQVSTNYRDGLLTMSGCVFNASVTLADISSDKMATPIANFDFDAEFAADNNSIGTTAPSGFDKSQFIGWTWADNNGELSNF